MCERQIKDLINCFVCVEYCTQRPYSNSNKQLQLRSAGDSPGPGGGDPGGGGLRVGPADSETESDTEWCDSSTVTQAALVASHSTRVLS